MQGRSLVLFAFKGSEQVSTSWDSYNPWRILKLCTHDIVRYQLARAIKQKIDIYVADETGIQCRVAVHRIEGSLDQWKIIFKDQENMLGKIEQISLAPSWPSYSYAWVELKQNRQAPEKRRSA